jgi:hypothetical protein
VFQGPAQLVGLDADDRIGRLVEVLPPAEYPGGDRVTLYFLRISGERLFYNKIEERFLSVGCPERRSGYDPPELLLNAIDWIEETDRARAFSVNSFSMVILKIPFGKWAQVGKISTR